MERHFGVSFMRIFLTLTFLTFLLGCAPQSSERYKNGESEEEVISLLNERDYSKAIFLLEQNDPSSLQGKTAFLLGQSYLGRAGIEPLEFAAKVMGPQQDSVAARDLFPDCPIGRLNSIKETKLHCVLKRIYLIAPPADHPDMENARKWFRIAYPDATKTSPWINTLVGLTETISVIKRVGDVYLFVQQNKNYKASANSRAQVHWLKTHGKKTLEEARHSLQRANHSGDKISQYLNGAKANQWFERVEGAVVYSKEAGITKFLDFVRDNLLKPEQEIKYGESMDKLRVLLETFEKN